MRLSACGEKPDLESGAGGRFDDIALEESGPFGACEPAVCEPATPGPVVIGKFVRDLIITACGALTSAITAVLLYWIEEAFHVSIYTWTWWFIPAGAVLAGFAASGGYYFGARYFAYRPSRRILLDMIGISIGTFFLVHWLRFMSLNVGGELISERMSFQTYLDFLFRRQSLMFSFRSISLTTGELGAWGYLYALLQISGFALGGVSVFYWLSKLPYCAKCSRYLSALSKEIRFENDPRAFASMLEQTAATFNSDRPQDVMARHATLQPSKSGRRCRFKSTLSVRFCPTCGVHWVGFSACKKIGVGLFWVWREVKGATCAGFYDDAPLVSQESARTPPPACPRGPHR